MLKPSPRSVATSVGRSHRSIGKTWSSGKVKKTKSGMWGRRECTVWRGVGVNSVQVRIQEGAVRISQLGKVSPSGTR